MVPTPLLYFSAQHLKADGAIMITGSHNPAEFNGFKTVCGTGTLHGETIQEVRRLIEQRDFERGRGQRHRPRMLITPYVDEVAPQFQFERRIKVVVDAGNGTAGPGDPSHLREAQRAMPPSCSSRWTAAFPNHHPDPTVPANLKHLIDAVQRQRTPNWASPSMAIPTASARWTKTANVIYGDMLMLIYRPRDSHPQARRHLHRRSEVLAVDVRRD